MRVLAFIDGVSKVAAGVAALLVFGIAGLIVAEVVARSFLSTSLSFAWEYSAYFYGCAVFLGAGYTMRTGGHVRVALLKGVLPERGKHVMEIIATGIAAAFSVFLAYAMIQFAWRSYVRGSAAPTIEATPLAIPQSVLAFGATLLALQLIARLIRLIIGEAPDDEETQKKFTVE